MKNSTSAPLVVDLDGTLTATDTLHESLIKLIRKSPIHLLYLPIWLIRGRACFKEEIGKRIRIDATLLPYRPALLAYLHEQKDLGRRLVLATAADQAIADKVNAHLRLFDQVLASGSGHNLKGRAKLEAIQSQVAKRFVYAGDSTADVPIWQAADAAILVGAGRATAATVRSSVPVEREFGESGGQAALWLKALRVHQWLKNLLLLVPLLTAFSFSDLGRTTAVLLAFGAFCLAASGSYLLNDLWDLDSDRAHPRKRHRPFACARLPIARGLQAAIVLLAGALVLAHAVSPAFLGMLLLYLLATTCYSWALKEYVLIDVLMLSLLYTLRILAGAVAASVPVSSWLLAFSVFMFLSLALVKRCAELVSLEATGHRATSGRDYRVADLTVLWPLGASAGIAAVVVFGLFISAPESQAHYATPQLLWLCAIGLIYWLGRLWIKTSRGEMHDDPIVYALKDRGSRITLACMAASVLAAHALRLQAWS